MTDTPTPTPEPLGSREVVDLGSRIKVIGDPGALFAALAKAQAELSDPAPNKANSHFHSKYADLSAILKAVRPVLGANGLSLLQLPCNAGDGLVGLMTIIGHGSGAYVTSVVATKPDRSGIHAVGSALTYLRRYSAAAAAGIAADEDDDGNAAAPAPQPRGRQQQQRQPQRQAAPKPAANEGFDGPSPDELKARWAAARADLEVQPWADAEEAAIRAEYGKDYVGACEHLEGLVRKLAAGDSVKLLSTSTGLSQEEAAQQQAAGEGE